MASSKITVETLVHAPLEQVWDCWTKPEHIVKWNAASEDWHTVRAENDLREGGVFNSRMEAKDGSAGFDFEGTYTTVVPQERLVYQLGDERTVEVTFEQQGDDVKVTETFDTEDVNSAELQRTGWQAILDEFKKYTEAL